MREELNIDLNSFFSRKIDHYYDTGDLEFFKKDNTEGFNIFKKFILNHVFAKIGYHCADPCSLISIYYEFMKDYVNNKLDSDIAESKEELFYSISAIIDNIRKDILKSKSKYSDRNIRIEIGLKYVLETRYNKSEEEVTNLFKNKPTEVILATIFAEKGFLEDDESKRVIPGGVINLFREMTPIILNSFAYYSIMIKKETKDHSNMDLLTAICLVMFDDFINQIYTNYKLMNDIKNIDGIEKDKNNPLIDSVMEIVRLTIDATTKLFGGDIDSVIAIARSVVDTDILNRQSKLDKLSDNDFD